jgi:hypothetical protein
MTLLERVRFAIEWRLRNNRDAVTDEVINRMTPVELLTEISEALEQMKKEEA